MHGCSHYGQVNGYDFSFCASTAHESALFDSFVWQLCLAVLFGSFVWQLVLSWESRGVLEWHDAILCMANVHVGSVCNGSKAGTDDFAAAVKAKQGVGRSGWRHRPS